MTMMINQSSTEGQSVSRTKLMINGGNFPPIQKCIRCIHYLFGNSCNNYVMPDIIVETYYSVTYSCIQSPISNVDGQGDSSILYGQAEVIIFISCKIHQNKNVCTSTKEKLIQFQTFFLPTLLVAGSLISKEKRTVF